ncbi:MAG: hypothetical protein HC808_14575 [Candidatus Competibacteraceae bacterium]|nr:hypothetical protein [Candidatus Competibacteraceae bacterium]
MIIAPKCCLPEYLYAVALNFWHSKQISMSKSDKLKEEIGWLKVVFAILVATDISLVAWLVQNYNGAPVSLALLCSIAVVFTTAGVIWINRSAYRKIDELEDL